MLCKLMKRLSCFGVILVLLIVCFAYSQKKLIDAGRYAIQQRLLQSVLAKEVCTCTRVMNYGSPGMDIKQRKNVCLTRNKLPMPMWVIQFITNSVESSDGTHFMYDVSWAGRLFGSVGSSPAMAIFRGMDKGCQLVPEQEAKSAPLYKKL